MFGKIVMFTLNCFLLSQLHARTIEKEPKYRTDYRYVLQQDAFYKVHRELDTWNNAYAYCYTEGSSLLYPKTVEETTLFVEMVQEFLSNQINVWVGAHSLFAPNTFVDGEGVDIMSYYAPWYLGDPNQGRAENCVEMRSDKKLRKIDCASRRPFVCKRLNRDITINSACQTPDAAYFPYENGTRCYKVHMQPKSWSEAFTTCNLEQAYLSIINDKEEAEFIIKAISSVLVELPDSFNVNYKYIAIGFHDKIKEGVYQTIHGQDLSEVYKVWSSGQRRDDEDCGALSVDGFLDDVNCDYVKMRFVCERDIMAVDEKPTIS